MAAKKKTLSIRRARDRATGALHTSVGRVTRDQPCDVPEDEARGLIDAGIAELVGSDPHASDETDQDDHTATGE